jgi:hypothetical protein
MKTINTTFNSKVKVTIKLHTKMDNFHESTINVGADNWIVLKRNTSEGGVDVKFLDKFTPITQDLAHFEDGKFDFTSHMSKIKFIALFKKHPKLKRELLKVSYPMGKYMSLNLDMERFKRSVKYRWIKITRSVKQNFSF